MTYNISILGIAIFFHCSATKICEVWTRKASAVTEKVSLGVQIEFCVQLLQCRYNNKAEKA